MAKRAKKPKKQKKQKPARKPKASPWKGVLTILVILLLLAGGIAFAVYASLSQAVITLTPVQQPVSTTFALQLGRTTVAENGQVSQLAGTLIDRSIEETLEVKNLEKQEITSRAGGKVRLINGRDGPIRLVKETQLKPEGKDVVFRIQENVEIPTQGEIEVQVLADEEGEIGEIPPSRFEIVKLTDSWKDQVYAQSDSPMQGGSQFAEVLSQEQIDGLRDTFVEDIRKNVLKEIQEENPDLTFPEEGVIIEPEGTDTSAEPGEEVQELDLTARVRLIAFAFQEHALLDVALQRLRQEIPDGYAFLGVTDGSFGYVIDSYDTTRGTARLTVSIDGVANAVIDPDGFDRESLVGRDALETQNYFEQFDTVEAVDVYFAPFWTTTVPRLASHAEIVVERPEPVLPEPEATEPPVTDVIPEPAADAPPEEEVAVEAGEATPEEQ